LIVGFRCAVCGVSVDITTACPWTCPNATPADPYHVLHLVDDGTPSEDLDDGNPFVRYGRRLAWWAFARANGMSDIDCTALTRAVAEGFAITPFGHNDPLSVELAHDTWIKDEIGNVGGSHKARHLVAILLHLRAAEEIGLLPLRAPLAIASCGNAAIVAATLAQRVDWPIDVFVPTWMSAEVGQLLEHLEARIHTCDRRAADPPGDPAMLRFREAVADGAIPFTVQGPENALCLDGGRTLGWEMRDALPDPGPWRAVVQVGGGALAACVGVGLGPAVRLDTVQAEGCAPLAAAWSRLTGRPHPERDWSEVMQVWPHPRSLADGILDDQTYDWLADVEAMKAGGGQPIVATESDIVRAHRLATDAGFDVSATGSAGLAGALTVRRELDPDERLILVMSGVAR